MPLGPGTKVDTLIAAQYIQGHQRQCSCSNFNYRHSLSFTIHRFEKVQSKVLVEGTYSTHQNLELKVYFTKQAIMIDRVGVKGQFCDFHHIVQTFLKIDSLTTPTLSLFIKTLDNRYTTQKYNLSYVHHLRLPKYCKVYQRTTKIGQNNFAFQFHCVQEIEVD